VICFVYDRILWATEPFQFLVEAHLLGYKAGQQSGDIVFAFKNLALAILTDYFAGQSLDIVQRNVMDLMSKLEIHGLEIFLKNPVLILSQITVLKEGKVMPSEGEILADARSGPSVLAYGRIYLLTRAFLFRQMNGDSIQFNTSEAGVGHQLNPHFLIGYFFEGLAAFHIAREASGNDELANGMKEVNLC
jgi:hypothetical protein